MLQTSTPLIQTPQRNNLRKSLLTKDLNNTSMSLRRLSNVAQQTPINQVLVDDDLERNLRRSEADLHKRVSNIGPQTPTNLNDKEIGDHFQICLKMFAENKISSKNAWNLRIIDFMRTIFSKGQAKDSLQVAGTSLDASTKIYGIRVDDIHSDGLKLASNMARVNPENEEANEEEQDDNDQGKQKQPKKKKPRVNGQKATVAKDCNSLISDVPKLESVFFQTRMDLEASTTDNLFTNKLPMHPSGYKYMLLSKDRSWYTYDNPIDLNGNNTYQMDITKCNKIHICAQFANFEIDEWDPDNEKEMLNYNRTINEEVAFDTDGIPIPELDGSVHDLFANNVEQDNVGSSDEEQINEIGQIAFNNRTVPHITDFRLENETCTNEYSYVNGIQLMDNKHLMQVWAGPSHWKLKSIKTTASRFSGQQEKQTKSTKKARLETPLINFMEEECVLNKTKIYKIKRRNVDDNPYKCTLPQVLIDSMQEKAPLMLKHVYLQHSSKEDNVIDKEMAPYNYENPDDSQYCAENGFGDDSHEGGEGDFINEEGAPVGLQRTCLGENLIDAPELVPKSYIPYAMQAKKMDMKKLKTAIWKGLISKTPNEIIPDDNMYKKEVQPIKFSSLYKYLPDRLTEKMREELSCPLAFVALLHLANEQNLLINGQPDLSDFAVSQQKQFIPL
ncbi:hypothetical protein FQR65_LT05432 [Abscondita terminalis]|nr:hypothetical protein FQR65_LT05432 [Abscondita terminalis]